MIKIRFISIFIISLLLINTFLSVNVYADWDKKDNEGIWIDEFNNDDDIILNNCVLENGIIKLEEGTPEYSYDYKNICSRGDNLGNNFIICKTRFKSR
jgi:hypothetical protein